MPGTLRHDFDLAGGLVSPFARAVYVMFLVAEVHPFTDGNGRIARVMMNSELETAGEVRIIIPTAYRANYLAALKGATHGAPFQGLAAMLAIARHWTGRVDFLNREHADNDVNRTRATRGNAKADADADADAAGIRLILP